MGILRDLANTNNGNSVTSRGSNYSLHYWKLTCYIFFFILTRWFLNWLERDILGMRVRLLLRELKIFVNKTTKPFCWLPYVCQYSYHDSKNWRKQSELELFLTVVNVYDQIFDRMLLPLLLWFKIRKFWTELRFLENW